MGQTHYYYTLLLHTDNYLHIYVPDEDCWILDSKYSQVYELQWRYRRPQTITFKRYFPLCKYSLELNFDHLFLFSDRPALFKNGRPETRNRELIKIGLTLLLFTTVYPSRQIAEISGLIQSSNDEQRCTKIY